METTIVLDTSVLIKWFRPEEVLTEAAQRLRLACENGRIIVIVPVLVAYELANVLCHKNDLTTGQVQQAMQILFDLGLDWVPPSSALVGRAVEIARECGLSVYDATFVAVAEFAGATLVTADERLIRRLRDWPHVRFLGDA